MSPSDALRERIAGASAALGVTLALASLASVGSYAIGGSAASLRFGLGAELLSVGLLLGLSRAARWVSRVERLEALTAAILVAVCFSLTVLGGRNLAHGLGVLPPVGWSVVVIAAIPVVLPLGPGRTATVAGAAALAVTVGLTLARPGGDMGRLIAAMVPPWVTAGLAVWLARVLTRTTVGRDALHARERLTGAVIEAAPDPTAVRVDDAVVLANRAARQLLEDRDPLADALHGEPPRGGWVREVHPVSGDPSMEVVVLRELGDAARRTRLAQTQGLLRSLVHELRNSVGPLRSLVHVLTPLVTERSEARAPIASLRRRIDHLLSFVEEYAELARTPSPVSRWTSWSGVLEPLSDLFTFECEVRRERGFFDPAQAEQVVINLITNALQHGGGPPRVTVEAHQGGSLVQVLDTGPGFSEEALARATEPFFTTRDGGFGIGLALCMRIVDGHGGWIAVRNRPGGGGCVRCWFPDGPETAPPE